MDNRGFLENVGGDICADGDDDLNETLDDNIDVFSATTLLDNVTGKGRHTCSGHRRFTSDNQIDDRQ